MAAVMGRTWQEVAGADGSRGKRPESEKWRIARETRTPSLFPFTGMPFSQLCQRFDRLLHQPRHQ